MSNYICKKCGSTKFSHDVTDVYEEVFDSKEKSIEEGKHYSDGAAWSCNACGHKISKEDTKEFMSQMYDASM